MDIDADVRDHLLESLDVAVRCGYGREDHIADQFDEQVRDELRGHDRAAVDEAAGRWMAQLRAGLAQQREREQTWTERTHNDRIDAAFGKLAARGIVALQDAGYTMSDGWSDVHEARRRVKDAWGAVFFHRQDVERGVEGKGLMLAFGAFVDGDAHEAESVRVGRVVCEALAAEGVATEWDGTTTKRIAIVPFEWRKRRSTRAPA